MYLLAPFIMQNFKKLLGVDQELSYEKDTVINSTKRADIYRYSQFK